MTRSSTARLIAAALLFFVVKAGGTDLAGIRKTLSDAYMLRYTVTEEMNNEFISFSDRGRASNNQLVRLYVYANLPDKEVERLLGLSTEEGSFTDVNYADTKRTIWDASLHFSRLLPLAILYNSPDSRWYRNDRIGRLIHAGLAYWGELMPVCPNWWYNEVDVPQKCGAMLLLMYDELSEEEKAVGVRILDKSKFGRTGQNKVWLAGNRLMLGLLMDDETLVREARDQIAEEIRVATPDEGIQADWSFHQHGPQLQFGNYGLNMLERIAFWMRVLHGSDIDFTPEQYEVIYNFANEGLRWCIWQGVMDPSACGRQVTINSGKGKAHNFYLSYQNLKAFIGDVPEDPKGARYFPLSDFGIYRTSDWYASIRMHSERTVGFEFTNKENQGGWFSADGALLLMQHGREYENIFACWDWRKVPGVTAYDDGLPFITDNAVEAKRNNSSHVGGAVMGDVMMTTMELDRDGMHALKSSFFFKDMVAALGSGICTTKPGVFSLTTALDQTRLVTDSEENPAMECGEGWAWHDGRGYVLLDDATLSVETGMQYGNWRMINPGLGDRPDSVRVFKAYISHDPSLTDNSYAYVLLPQFSQAKTKRFARRPRLRVLRNDETCQAVRYKRRIYAIVHVPGTVRIGRRDYYFDEAALAVIRRRRVQSEPIVV